ncbi:phage tail family protein [Bombilactobacillus folatiphilus]|uniref:Phage tail family protein n=1 Tax=Bombilactobacillus folatiphilus TaxID=2923362 RepID=A0ABY4PA52_9LACO|nr:distal tail protein Dit [Bombilactobacillus folatiphilus]UQS82610.1 phage tail family protein [Bombilactobacillus folatiphilus]
MYEFRDLSSNDSLNDNLPAEAMAFQRYGQFDYLEDLIPGYRTLQVTGRELTAYKLTEETPSGMDGSIVTNQVWPSRDIKIKYLLNSDTPYDFRQKYNKLMYFLSNQTLTFNFKDEADYFFYGGLSDVDTPEGGQSEVVSDFTLHCPSPWKFSDVKSLTVSDGQTINDHYLIYPVVPESISFTSTKANFQFQNVTSEQTFGLNTAHTNVVLAPNTGEVSANGQLILNDIVQFSELEQLKIKNGDQIKITNGSSAVIQYRRWLL